MGSSLHHHVHCVGLPNPVCSDTSPKKTKKQSTVRNMQLQIWIKAAWVSANSRLMVRLEDRRGKRAGGRRERKQGKAEWRRMWEGEHEKCVFLIIVLLWSGSPQRRQEAETQTRHPPAWPHLSVLVRVPSPPVRHKVMCWKYRRLGIWISSFNHFNRPPSVKHMSQCSLWHVGPPQNKVPSCFSCAGTSQQCVRACVWVCCSSCSVSA